MTRQREPEVGMFTRNAPTEVTSSIEDLPLVAACSSIIHFSKLYECRGSEGNRSAVNVKAGTNTSEAPQAFADSVMDVAES